MNTKVLIMSVLSAVCLSACCETCEKEKKKLMSDVARLEGQLARALGDKQMTEETLAETQKQLQEAKEEINRLKAKAEADAKAAEIEKQEAIKKAVAEAEVVAREERIKRLREKASDREKAREEAKRARLNRADAGRVRTRERKEAEVEEANDIEY